VHDRGVGTPGESLQRAKMVPGSLPRKVGNGISATIPRNRVGKVSVIPRKKVLISRFTKESIPKLGMEWNYMKKICFTKNPAPVNKIESATARIPPDQTKCSVYSVFRGIIFCLKLPTLLPRSGPQG
jgi:hypothetical protein